MRLPNLKLPVFSFAVAIVAALSFKANASNLKFNVTGYTSDCAHSASVNCSPNPTESCTFNFGGTIGTKDVYEKDANQNCTVTLGQN